MRLLVCIVFVVCACAAFTPTAARGGYEFSFAPRPGDFGFERALDPGGGGNTFVLDAVRASFPVGPVPVQADTYTFHFDLAASPLRFSPSVDRIDLMAPLGAIEAPYGVVSSAGQNLGTLTFAVDNLTRTSLPADTVTYYAAGSFVNAVGVGVDESVAVGPYTAAPGEPFILRSLDVTFRIPPQFIPSGAPDSPAGSIVLRIAAGDNLPTGDVATLGPLVQVVPEPAAWSFALAATLSLLVRRR